MAFSASPTPPVFFPSLSIFLCLAVQIASYLAVIPDWSAPFDNGFQLDRKLVALNVCVFVVIKLLGLLLSRLQGPDDPPPPSCTDIVLWTPPRSRNWREYIGRLPVVKSNNQDKDHPYGLSKEDYAQHLQTLPGISRADVAHIVRSQRGRFCPRPGDGRVIRERVSDHVFERRFINKEVGHGLVTTEFVPAGTVLIAEDVMAIWGSEQRACKTLPEANTMIETKARAMGSEWFDKFMSLSCHLEETVGLMAGIWDGHHLPFSWNGKSGTMLGPNLAHINHSCIPNCSLTMTTTYPTGEAGEVLWDQKPRMGRAVVRACTDIRAGVEISISYILTHGVSKTRKRETACHLGFKCACHSCQIPPVPVQVTDAHLYAFNRMQATLRDPHIIANKPAVAYSVANDLLGQLFRVSCYDIRLVMVWFKCALIAAYHSDMARVYCFLSRAKDLALTLEGPGGFFYRLLLKWSIDPDLMPGFGATSRGCSSLSQSTRVYHDGVIARRILFMLDAKPEQYIRVSRCRRVGPRSSGQSRWEILDGSDPVPPVLDVKSKGHCATCHGKPCKLDEMKRRELQEHRKRRKRMKKIADEKAAYLQSMGCVDPEKDFLDLFMEVVHDFENGGFAEGEQGEASVTPADQNQEKDADDQESDIGVEKLPAANQQPVGQHEDSGAQGEQKKKKRKRSKKKKL